MRTARRVVLVLGSTQVLVSALVIVATQSGSSAVVYVLLGFLICAATAIVGLEGSMEAVSIVAPVGAGATAVAMTGTTALPAAGPERSLAPRAVTPPSSWPRTPTWATRGATLALAVLGLGVGLSPLFSAYFDTSVWVPIGLVVILAGGVSAIVRPPGASLPVVLSLTALAGLGLWSLLSVSWAQAAEQATVDGNRWLAYAALLMLLIVLVRRRVHASVLLAAVGAGILVVAVTVLVRMLGSDPISLFIGGRLNSPLGYINGEGCVFAMGCWLSLALAERRQPVLAGSRNAAVARARGEYVFVLDADSGVYPSALGRLVAALDEDPEAAFAYPMIAALRDGRPVSLLQLSAVGAGASEGRQLHRRHGADPA